MINDLSGDLHETFLQVLVADVIRAMEREPAEQSNRRDLIRASFAAIEGLVWIYRNHVEGVAKDIDEISPLTESGVTKPEDKFLTTIAMIKCTTNKAQKLSPDLKVDFGVQGWADLVKFIKIRNRITHPKTLAELHISDNDLDVAQSAFFWLLNLVGDVMKSSNEVSAKYVEKLRELSALLENGDEEALALYRMAAEGKLE